jgi:hypothetical protein
MPLRGRVGRRAHTGRHCQNWKEDQRTVISLLNRIPIADGGAEGTLNVPVISGLASDGLYSSILFFEKRHFPGRPSGIVEPGGLVLAKLELLATRPAAPPPKAGQWDTLASKSVRRALRKGLEGDLTIDFAEAVDIIRSALSDGFISANELADLSTIAVVSRSISPRSKALLHKYVTEVKSTVSGIGPYRLPLEKHRFAAEMVCDFLKRSSGSFFPRLHRDEIGIGLLMRIANPGILRQGQASLCGPAALLHGVASDQPGQYARFAIDLFENGRAKIGRLLIEPGKAVRSYLPQTGEIHQVDWMTMASIRDSENWFFDYDSVEREFAGITLPGELAHWFRLAGYSDIREETNLTSNKGSSTLDDASRLVAQGYRVCMFINSKMLDATEQAKTSMNPDHWVVLRSEVDRSGEKVRLKVFTWGTGNYEIPQAGTLSLSDFLGNFYGYVAGKA